MKNSVTAVKSNDLCSEKGYILGARLRHKRLLKGVKDAGYEVPCTWLVKARWVWYGASRWLLKRGKPWIGGIECHPGVNSIVNMERLCMALVVFESLSCLEEEHPYSEESKGTGGHSPKTWLDHIKDLVPETSKYLRRSLDTYSWRAFTPQKAVPRELVVRLLDAPLQVAAVAHLITIGI
ncbi:hypothetical protein BDZ89DRAFT_1039647 [Hymenopellis radicata]|nr:hypothetical protein BDZ89DRAFT_1039647 [Hymenopellis radicata]